MELREKISTAVKEAMKARETERLSTLRLMNAAIKDRDIANRMEGSEELISEADIVALLGKMVRQREDSAETYTAGGRPELAAKELAEVAVIKDFMPRQMDEAEIEAAIAAAIAETQASTLRDMGKVLGVLKEKHMGQMDFGKVGALVKARLA